MWVVSVSTLIRCTLLATRRQPMSQVPAVSGDFNCRYNCLVRSHSSCDASHESLCVRTRGHQRSRPTNAPPHGGETPLVEKGGGTRWRELSRSSRLDVARSRCGVIVHHEGWQTFECS